MTSTLRRLSTLAALALLSVPLAVSPGPARAGDAECLWNATRKVDRDAFFAAYAKEGPAAVRLVVGPDPAAANAIPRACKVNPANDAYAGEALGDFAKRIASAVVLKARFGVEPVRLRQAYMALPAADRARLGGMAVSHGRAPADIAFAQATMTAAAKRLNLTDPIARQQLTIYFAASAALDWTTPRF